jgi:hypothetical protein
MEMETLKKAAELAEGLRYIFIATEDYQFRLRATE